MILDSGRFRFATLAQIGFVIGLIAVASPASAQSWLEKLLGGGKEPAPAAPAPSPPAASAPPAPKAAAPKAAPAPQGAQSPPGAQPPAQAANPAPMPRPPSAPPAGQSASGAATAPAQAALSDREIVDRTNGYFNRIRTLTGDFSQISADGRRTSGKLYLQRPGKLRFEYTPPSMLEVVADGSQVAVRDRKLATQDLYPISQTPLKFLLRERIDLESDTRLAAIDTDQEGVKVQFADVSTLGGTSVITLYFDRNVEVLNQWRIQDPQGFVTMVSLTNLDASKRVDQRLFAIDYTRLQDTNSSR